MIEWRYWIGIGALAAGVAISLGAFGAHALKQTLNEQQLQWYQTAFEYQMIHSLALVALGLFASRINNFAIQISGWSFCLGIILFSGSLYLMALGQPRNLAILTPFGGLSFIVGWVLLAVSAFRSVV